MKYKILVVDDEPANTRMLERLFREHYEVITAQSGAAGLEALDLYDVALIISDQRMPGMTGVEFLKRSAEVRPHCVRIILTGYTDAGDLADALNSGVVYKYVTKPWVNIDLVQTVKRSLSHHETIKAQHRLNLENERLRERATATADSYMNLCFEMLSLKNSVARERALRVRSLTLGVGTLLNLDTAFLETLGTAAYLHGIADVYVPSGMQHRKDAMTEAERTFVAESRGQGLDLLRGLSNSGEIIEAIRFIPEHYDGSGWPDGLRNEQIPLSSRIIAVAKEYDELLFPDSKMNGRSVHDAITTLHAAAGQRFDPDVVRAFCSLVATAEEYGLPVAADHALAR